MRSVMLASAILMAGAFAGSAWAQSPPAGAPQGDAGLDGTEQVVGLFSATCMNFAGDVTAMRGFLNEQHAPQMPQAARDAFLAGRHGQVFDVSYQQTKLALVSLDDGGCEAVAERAKAAGVTSLLNKAAQENQVALTPLGAQGGAGQAAKERPGVQQTAFGLTLAGHPMHILVSTEGPAPQAVLTLVPK